MIKKEYIDKLNANLSALAKRYGIAKPIVAEQGGETVGVIEISKELHEKSHREIDSIFDDFIESEDGIVEAHDYHLGKAKLKKGHSKRYLIFSVAEDKAYDSPYDKKTLDAMMARMSADSTKPTSKYAEKDPATGLYQIPPPAKNASNEVYLPLAYEPFDAIKSGEKKTEFRAYTPRYVKMLLSKPPKTVKFQRGYGKGAEQMVWSVKTVDLYDIKTRRSARPGSEPKDFRPTHIAIDLAVRIDGKTQKVRTQ